MACLTKQQLDYIACATARDLTRPDEEDITLSEELKLQFKDRDSKESQKGYVILRSDKTFAEQVAAENTIYEIRYAFDLNGVDVVVPSGSTLLFNGGSITNGLVYLSDGCKVRGDGKFIIKSTQLWSFTQSTGVETNIIAGVVCQAVENISIEGIDFLLEDDSNKKALGVIGYGYRTEGTKKLTVSNCHFYDCGVAFLSNTKDSRVDNCIFEGSNEAVFRNETLYDQPRDGETLRPWGIARNNAFCNNTVINTNTNGSDSGNLLWCSGVDSLDISGNHFEAKRKILSVYCGDDSVILRGARIVNNSFVLKEGYVASSIVIDITGLSFVWTQPSKRVKCSAYIGENSIVCETPNYTSLIASCIGISASFMDSITIESNVIDGFAYPVICNTERSSGGVITNSDAFGDYVLRGNTISRSFYTPVRLPSNPKRFLLVANNFKECNYSTVSYPRAMFDLNGKTNISIIDNLFDGLPERSGYSSPWMLAYPSNCYKCVFVGNRVDGMVFRSQALVSYFMGRFETEPFLQVGSFCDNMTVAGSFEDGYNGAFFNRGTVITFLEPDTVTIDGVDYKRNQAVVTESGTFKTSKTITGAQGSAGDKELTYESASVQPGMIILIDTTEYEVLFVYNRKVTVPQNHTLDEDKNVIVLNKAIHRDVSDETILTQKCSIENVSIFPVE